MIEIENTSSMNEYLDSGETNVVKFPAEVNILLVGGCMASEVIDKVDSVAAASRRSLHLR